MRISVLVLGLILAGCGNSEEQIFKENCEDLLKLSVVNPSKVSFNSVTFSEGALDRAKAEELVRGPGQDTISPSRSAVFDIWYGNNKDLPKQVFVQIDATDEGGLTPRRDNVTCWYYSDKIQTKLVSASLSRGQQVKDGDSLMAFIMGSSPPRHMDILGNIKRK